MNAKTLFAMAQKKELSLMGLSMVLFKNFYKVGFAASAAKHGILSQLHSGPRTLDQLAGDIPSDRDIRESFGAWLDAGVRLGELSRDKNGYYSLRGFLSKRLADPVHDAIAAFFEEVADLHHKLIMELPERLRKGEKFTLSDQDGALIARSSRTVEPFVAEAIDFVFEEKRPGRLLEIGCGSGIHIRHAVRRIPHLIVLGLELQKEVAAFAEKNLEEWELTDRVIVENNDIRDLKPKAIFDMATLHNNIYYFPVEKRVELLAHIREFLKPGGTLLLTTGCQGGSAPMEILNLWAASTLGAGRLPSPDEMKAQLIQAGFRDVRAKNLLPGDSYYAFWGSRED